MKNHTKVYLEYFGYSLTDWIACEWCGKEAVAVHHLSPRGMGGSKKKDYIENLVALCYEDHEKAEHDKKFNAEVSVVHRKNCLKSKHDSGEIKRV